MHRRFWCGLEKRQHLCRAATNTGIHPAPPPIQTHRPIRYINWTWALLNNNQPTMAAAIPTASEGTILVTGSNGDLGSAIARHVGSSPKLAAHHALYVVRNASSPNRKLRSALGSSKSGVQNHYDILSLDLASLSNVRSVASTINERVAKGEIPPGSHRGIL